MSDFIEELYDAIKGGTAYDFIASNYWQLDETMLKDILLEYIYAFDKITRYDNYQKEDIVNELKSRWEE